VVEWHTRASGRHEAVDLAEFIAACARGLDSNETTLGRPREAALREQLEQATARPRGGDAGAIPAPEPLRRSGRGSGGGQNPQDQAALLLRSATWRGRRFTPFGPGHRRDRTFARGYQSLAAAGTGSGALEPTSAGGCRLEPARARRVVLAAAGAGLAYGRSSSRLLAIRSQVRRIVHRILRATPGPPSARKRHRAASFIVEILTSAATSPSSWLHGQATGAADKLR